MMTKSSSSDLRTTCLTQIKRSNRIKLRMYVLVGYVNFIFVLKIIRNSVGKLRGKTGFPDLTVVSGTLFP